MKFYLQHTFHTKQCAIQCDLQKQRATNKINSGQMTINTVGEVKYSKSFYVEASLNAASPYIRVLDQRTVNVREPADLLGT